MAREVKIKKEELLVNGFIDVLHYFREDYKSNEERIYECSNCGLKNNHAHVYKFKDESIINICHWCNKLINNLKTLNPKFKKR